MGRATTNRGSKILHHEDTKITKKGMADGCEPKLCDQVHASPSLPSLTRQPALQRQGVGCRVKPGNDGSVTQWINLSTNRYKMAAGLLTGLLLLTGCAGGNVPPSQRGFFGGLSAAMTGDDVRRAQSLENTAAQAEASAARASQRAAAAQQEADATSAQVAAAQQRLNGLQQTLRNQRATLNQLRSQSGQSPAAAAEATRLQQELDAQDRAQQEAARRVGGPSPAAVQRLDQRSRELDAALRQFQAM